MRKTPKFKRIFISLILIFSTVKLSSAEENISSLPAQLNQLIQEALAQNLLIKTYAEKVKAAEKIIRAKGALPDPQLNLSLNNLPVGTFSFDQEPMTSKVLSWRQKFPFPGKLSLATEMAQQELNFLRQQKDEIQNQIIFRVKNLYYQLYSADRTLEVIEKNKEFLRQILKSVEAKYATGSGLQQDILQAQVELLKIDDLLFSWQEKRQSIAAEINAILNRSPDYPIKKTPPELALPSLSHLTLSSEELEKSRPLLLSWKEKVIQKEKELALAKKNLWPDLMIGLSYSQRNRLKTGQNLPDFYSVTLSLDLPIFASRKQKSVIAQKYYELEALKTDYNRLVRDLLSQVERARLKVERYQKQIELYREAILIQAEQSLSSVQAGYQVGKVDFQTVLAAWMNLQNYQMAYFQGIAKFLQAQAELEYLLGLSSSGIYDQSTIINFNKKINNHVSQEEENEN